MQHESEHREYKSRLTDDIYKEVIAFANADGGAIYIGIDDDGNIVGIDNVDDTYTRLTNGIRDAIHPDITMFVRYILEDNNVIRIDVNEGSMKPYYIKAKGLKPSGVYIRQGTSSVQASSELIRKMIKESDGDNYEDVRSLEQNLTFDFAKETFNNFGVVFAPEKYRILGISKAGIYTNLGLLLSDQCLHTTKIAVFNDEFCTEFRDSKEFCGSVFKQFADTVNYLSLCNKTVSKIKGIVRTDKKDYPDEAIREAFLNALVHRDYSYSGSIIINVNDKKMEFISLGGLLPGLSTEDIRIGVSQPRNKKLAEVFHRLRLIESYGTGIRRIFKLYENHSVQPVIEVTANAFKITLPNMNSDNEISEATTNAEGKKNATITTQEKNVLVYLEKYDEIDDEKLQELLNVKKTRAYVIAKRMRESGLIEIIGRGASKKYRLK